MLIVKSIERVTAIEVKTDEYVPIMAETGDSCMNYLWRAFQGEGFCELEFREDDCVFRSFVLLGHPAHTIDQLEGCSYGQAEIVEGVPVFERLKLGERGLILHIYESAREFVIEMCEQEKIVQVRFGDQLAVRIIRSGRGIDWGIGEENQLLFIRFVECETSLIKNLKDM